MEMAEMFGYVIGPSPDASPDDPVLFEVKWHKIKGTVGYPETWIDAYHGDWKKVKSGQIDVEAISESESEATGTEDEQDSVEAVATTSDEDDHECGASVAEVVVGGEQPMDASMAATGDEDSKESEKSNM